MLVMTYFSKDKFLLASCFSIAVFMADVQPSCIHYFHHSRPPKLRTAKPPDTMTISNVISIPLVCRKMPFPATFTLWNRRPKCCFPDRYNLNIFKSTEKRFVSYILSSYVTLFIPGFPNLSDITHR